MIGGAGGVGSILIQIAKALTGLTVVATASREQTVDWCKKMGADHIVSHRNTAHVGARFALHLAIYLNVVLRTKNSHFETKNSHFETKTIFTVV